MRREQILEVIKNHPGIGFNEIVRQTKLSNGVISHYILQLIKDGEISKIGIRARYFEYNIPQKDREIILIFRNETNNKILKMLLEEKNALKLQHIAKTIGRSTSTVSINMKKMEKAKIISRKIMNENSNLMSDIGYRIVEKKFLREIISKYNLN